MKFMVVAGHPKRVAQRFEVIGLAVPVSIPDAGQLGTLGNDQFGIRNDHQAKRVVEPFGEQMPFLFCQIVEKYFAAGHADHESAVRQKPHSVDLLGGELGRRRGHLSDAVAGGCATHYVEVAQQ